MGARPPFFVSLKGIMKVLFYCHYWAPYHFAGSEIMGQNILRYLREAGHETLVIATHEFDAPEEWDYEGTRVIRPRLGKTGFGLAEEFKPDVIITHHEETVPAVNYAQYFDVPVVQVVHNDMWTYDRYLALGADFVIFNTNHLQEHYAHFGYRSCVLHPPVFAQDHATTPGDMITLVNLNANKGSGLFYELAERMPDLKFLAVEGGHGAQVFEVHENVVFQRQTTNMRDDVWSRTRILLMPSVYESYGMAGVEALASGIPVIAHPTFGLMESLGEAGVFCDRDDANAWEVQIRHLMNDEEWRGASAVCKQRSDELNPEKELQNVTHELERLVAEWPTLPRKTSKRAWAVS